MVLQDIIYFAFSLLCLEIWKNLASDLKKRIQTIGYTLFVNVSN